MNKQSPWLEDGVFLVMEKPFSTGESVRLIAYSRRYDKVYYNWLHQPGWMRGMQYVICFRRNGANIRIKRPIPPKRLPRS